MAGPRIRNITPDEFRRLFSSPETQSAGPSFQETLSLMEALENKRKAEFERQLKVDEAVAKVKKAEAEAKRQRQLAAGINLEKQTELETLQQPKPPLQEGEARPIFGPQAQAAEAEKQQQIADLQQQVQSATAAVEQDPDLAAKQLLGQGDATADLRGRDIQQFQLVSPTGDRRLVSFVETAGGGAGELFDAVSGQPISQEQRAELSKQGFKLSRATPQMKTDAAGNLFVVDPNIGERRVEISAGGTTVPEEQIGTVTSLRDPALPPKDRKQVEQIIQSAQKDENAKKARNMISMNRNLQNAIATKNEVLIDRLGGQMQKLIAGDAGNLAQWEQRDPGSRQIVKRIVQYFKMIGTGNLTDVNFDDLQTLLQTYEAAYKDNLVVYSDQYATAAVNQVPQMSKEAVTNMIGFQVFQDKPKKAVTAESIQQMTSEQRKARIAELQAKQGGQ